ncbi:peptidoglycan-binding protein [Streptomyces sp. DSM 40750]|uniref:peptidoglycan-binding protein n=1 Tax=Streptomyces sp. DSM 40750 TaxID=2801030 RepID=UPI00214ACA1F|nr:peptidoglycan-binding protein [Streptomyces sp. DSM 40750]UUU22410.1 peptidoglycan-binding protein [Streptomyces sp. DSM 40750]
METPVFEEIDPGGDCECPGCLHWRRVMPYSAPYAHLGHPAARTARNALVVATAAGAALGAGHAVPAVAAAHGPVRPGVVPAGEEPDTPQGKKAPLHGPAGRPADGEKPPQGVATPPTTRAEIIGRAETWIAAQVPYSMSEYWSDGYRQDCSGFVSMAWNLPGNEWTGSLDKFAQRISKDRLEPGDMLLFHNPRDPQKGSHVVIFGGWTDYAETHYTAYESTRPYARRQATPYGYWNNATRYVPYRYKGLTDGGAGSSDDWTDGSGDSGSPGAPSESPGWEGAAGPSGGDRFPGPDAFGPGANNKYVTRLGQMLVERGGARFYVDGPGPVWSDADRRATQAFQRAQGWSGRDADGMPGPLTWSYLVTGRGSDIPPAGTPGSPGASGMPASHGVLGYPGRGMFRPGADNVYVTKLGKQLVKKGFGTYYTSGPGPRWGESDRRNVEAFQRAQGWRGGAADGYPGPETWRRLFH